MVSSLENCSSQTFLDVIQGHLIFWSFLCIDQSCNAHDILILVCSNLLKCSSIISSITGLISSTCNPLYVLYMVFLLKLQRLIEDTAQVSERSNGFCFNSKVNIFTCKCASRCIIHKCIPQLATGKWPPRNARRRVSATSFTFLSLMKVGIPCIIRV